MPTYSYRNPKTGKTKDLIQTMSQEHSYREDGVEWERVWTVPQAAVDANIDPFNQNAFVDKVGSQKGSLGDCFDRSAELSAKRAEKRGGTDEVKKNYFDAYKKKRNGKEHPSQVKERVDKINVTI